MTAILADLRFALRTFRRRRAFLAMSVKTLGSGIGAATSMFNVADRVLFRALPFTEPDRVVSVYQTIPNG